ncbi:MULTISPECIES: hypothetical protein [unclassified Caballeronia]|nr:MULTISPECIES: hypothetical protein [unclassified Caballeronia]MDR5814121.1 hypothetical protein [Caballeronia sp. LZ033]MDR5825590.1 hypothetical protein [Caballeronia sp. LZ043]MDR5878666.1 hypothetical protein [Caballeronia sp. LZ032]
MPADAPIVPLGLERLRQLQRMTQLTLNTFDMRAEGKTGLPFRE